jgi:hypothetical protein
VKPPKPANSRPSALPVSQAPRLRKMAVTPLVMATSMSA